MFKVCPTATQTVISSNIYLQTGICILKVTCTYIVSHTCYMKFFYFEVQCSVVVVIDDAGDDDDDAAADGDDKDEYDNDGNAFVQCKYQPQPGSHGTLTEMS